MAGNTLSPPYADDDEPRGRSVPGIGERYDQFDPAVAARRMAARALRVVAGVMPESPSDSEVIPAGGASVPRLGKIALPHVLPNTQN